MQYRGHKQEVRLLLPLGDQLISADSGGEVIVWDVQAGGRRISPTRNTEPRRRHCGNISTLALSVFPFCISRRLPAAAVRPRLLRRVGHDAPQHLPEQGAAGKLPGCTAAVEHQDQVSV